MKQEMVDAIDGDSFHHTISEHRTNLLGFYMQKHNKFHYICTMKSIEVILQKIEDIDIGVIFGYSDLNLPTNVQSASLMALSRLVADGTLRKVGKGRFYKPAISRLGEMPPMIEELTKDLLFKDGERIGYITGIPAFSQMGLTTQISSKIIIGANQYRRPLKRGGYDINFTTQTNEITDNSIPLLRILDALKYIKKIPAALPDEVISNIQGQLKRMPENERDTIIKYAMKYAPSVRALLGAILDNLGCYSKELKKSLNPFTEYNITISETLLPTKANWNIE